MGDTFLSELVLTLTPDLDGGRILRQGSLDGPTQGVSLHVRAYADGQQVGDDTVPAARRSSLAVLRLSRVVPWQPGQPFLYDVTLHTLREGKVLDRIRTYCGLRKLTLDGNRFLINDRPVFQRLILDQGFYPDGIYTAPTDDALRHDIELSLAAGSPGGR